MPRRELLTPTGPVRVFAFPEDEGELIRLATLARADLYWWPRRTQSPARGFRIASAGRHLQQRLELPALSARELRGEQPAQPCIHPIPQTRDEALEHARTGQQHLLRQHPARRSIEQRDRPVRAGPALRVQPAGERKACAWVGKRLVAVRDADLLGVRPALLTLRVFGEELGRGQPQAPAERLHYARRNRGQIFEEGAEKTHRGQLHSVAEAVVLAAFAGDGGAVGSRN